MISPLHQLPGSSPSHRKDRRFLNMLGAGSGGTDFCWKAKTGRDIGGISSSQSGLSSRVLRGTALPSASSGPVPGWRATPSIADLTHLARRVKGHPAWPSPSPSLVFSLYVLLCLLLPPPLQLIISPHVTLGKQKYCKECLHSPTTRTVSPLHL